MLPLRFPDKYEETVDGITCVIPFHTDFLQWMRFEELITDSRVPEDKVIITALRMIFPNELPRDMARAALFMLWFYRCGTAADNSDTHCGTVLTQSRRIYSFEEDFGYIASAFLEKYGIDLWESRLHWWKFHALLTGLHDCRFTDICGYRAADLSDDMTDSRRDFLEKMQEMYALPISANELRMIEAARRYLDG